MSDGDTTKHMKCWHWGIQDKQLTSRQSRMVLAVMFVFGLMTMFGLVRVAPVLTVLQQEFDFELANVGLIQTFYTLAGVILMFPGTWIMRKIGVKVTIVGACSIATIGAIIGVFAIDQASLLASRALEGVGAGIIMFMGANVCTRIFPKKKLGIAMAVWSIWAPAGAFLAFFVAPFLFETFGWRSLWLATAIVYAVCLVWLLMSFKLPKVNENEITVQNMKQEAYDQDSNSNTKTSRKMLASSIIMAGSFFVWGLVFGGSTNSFYPTYLMEVKGATLYEANFLPSLISLFTLPLGILAGFLSDKIGTRKWFVVFSYLAMAVVMAFFGWSESPGMISVIVFIIGMSIFSSCIPMGTRAAIPDYTPDPKISDYLLTTMVFVANLGQSCSVFFGATVAAVGWAGAGLYLLAPCCLVAGLATLFFCKNDYVGKRKREEVRNAMQE